MKITIDNYEAYLLDYFEGTIEPALEQELRFFLASHPELHTEMEDFSPVIVIPEKITFPYKKNLKKLEFNQDITENNFEDFCIAYHEKILSEKKIKELHLYCSTKNDKKKILDCFGKTYLQPDPKIRYPRKKALYKKTPIIHLLSLRIASAAAIILFFVTVSMYVINKNKSTVIQSINNEVAQVYSPNRMVKIQPITIPSKKNNIIQHMHIHATNKLLKQTVIEITDIPRQSVIEKEQTALLNPLEIGNIEPIVAGGLKISKEDYNAIWKNAPTQNKKILFKLAKLWQDVKKQSIIPEKLKIKNPKLSLIAICKAGIEGINSFTDANIKLSQEKDSLGNITILSFESESTEIQHNNGN